MCGWKGAAMLARWIMFAVALLPLQGVSILDRRWPGLEIAFNASVEPAGSGPAELPGAVLMRTVRVHRVIQDAAHQIYFGYDVLIDSIDGKTFQLHAEPLSLTAAEISGVNPAWARLSLPSKPVIPEIKLGATVKLELLVNPATGQKIIDAISVRERDRTAPRQFTVADVELQVERVRVRVNGQETPFTFAGGLSGSALWFYVPERGRFVVSLEPHTNSQRTGEVRFKKVTIRVGADVLEFESDREIAPGSGTFFLHVRHDRNWQPWDGSKFQMGSADRAEWVR